MTIRRSAAAVGAVAVGLFALSACSKPTPLATVTVGKGAHHTEAACYRHGKPLSQSQLTACLKAPAKRVVKVSSSDTFHLGVEPAIADKGWFLVINNQQKTNISKSTYQSFGAAQLFEDSNTGEMSSTADLNIVESGGSSGGAIGIWKFKLELKDS